MWKTLELQVSWRRGARGQAHELGSGHRVRAGVSFSCALEGVPAGVLQDLLVQMPKNAPLTFLLPGEALRQARMKKDGQ